MFIAVASFLVRLEFPVLSGEEPLALDLWEYLQMAALFTLGVLATERGWIVEGLTPRLRRTCGRAAGLGVALAVLLGVGITLSDDADPFLGGFRPEATLLPIALRRVGVPAELKFLTVFGLGAAASFGLGTLLGRSRAAGRIL